MTNQTRWLGGMVLGLGMGCGVLPGAWGDPVPEPPSVAVAPVVAVSPGPSSAAPDALPRCPVGVAGANPGMQSDAKARAAAQRGLDFLARDTVAWQAQHQCYGCHVQAVTLEAMVIGQRHHYEVRGSEFDEIIRGMLDLPGGAHGPVGFSVGDDAGHLYDSSQNFGGAALALYDEMAGDRHGAELLAAAERLLAFQEAHGGQRASEGRLPIGAGPLQATMQAAATWRQAYARSADERWLVPIGRAEGYLRREAQALQQAEESDLQSINYALLGLHAAGAHANDLVVSALRQRLLARQSQDGGWGFRTEESSNPFATGQSLWVLRRLGASDRDPAIARGVAWLIARQSEEGSWSTGGARRGEAMWGVLGLVSIDAVSLAIEGLQDGGHVGAPISVQGVAVANDGQRVERLEILVDDVPLHRACRENALSLVVDPGPLPTGRHHLDLVAANGAGQESRVRVEFFTGDHFITQEGSRFDAGQTRFSWRNVAPTSIGGTVHVEIRAHREGPDGQAMVGPLVHEADLPAVPGAMHFEWAGPAGDLANEARYQATMIFRDVSGRERHRVVLPFVHDTHERQEAKFAAIEGALNLDAGGLAANAEVELLDDQGRVVQKVTSTRSGRYKFKNVDAGEYEVRVKRKGFKEEKARVQAAPQASKQTDLNLVLEDGGGQK